MHDAVAHHAALDRRMIAAARGIRVLALASWPASVQRRFLDEAMAGRLALPRVAYPPQDFSDARRELDAVAREADPSHPLGIYLIDSARQWSIAAELVEALGTPAVCTHSLALYGGPAERLPGSELTARDAARHFIGIADEFDTELIAPHEQVEISATALQLWLQGEGPPQPDEPSAELGFELQRWHLQLAYRPGDFVQVNGLVNAAMVAQALDWLGVQPGERVLDLFCGLGNFALPLARQAAEVVAVEGVEAMVQRAADNARNNGLGNAHFYRADLSNPLANETWARGGFTAVLLDPPREPGLVHIDDQHRARTLPTLQQRPLAAQRAGEALFEEILDVQARTGAPVRIEHHRFL